MSNVTFKCENNVGLLGIIYTDVTQYDLNKLNRVNDVSYDL